MLNIAIIRCKPTCKLRCVCHSHASDMPHVHGPGMRQYCRDTRWLVVGGMVGIPIVTMAAWLVRHFA